MLHLKFEAAMNAFRVPGFLIALVLSGVCCVSAEEAARVIVTPIMSARTMSERLGQQFVIENRAGDAGNVGVEAVVGAPADGYTLLVVGSNHAVNATLYDKLNFNFIRDIAPVAGVLRAPSVLVVNPSVPAKTVSEFITYAKANPRKLNMASAGSGTPPHIAGRDGCRPACYFATVSELSNQAY
jgi:tripartite-type tricarboxylate transporter receptor subunit TctC